MTVIPLEAVPLTQQDIREYATRIRRALGLSDVPEVDVAHLIEILLPQTFTGFVYDVRSKEEMGNKHGEASPDARMICLREDVYEGVINGNGRDRVTALHEVGHVLLHTSDRTTLCKANGKLEDHKNPEWQADCFAREFLASHLFISRCRSAEDLAKLTGVSLADAKIQWEAYKRDGLIK